MALPAARAIRSKSSLCRHSGALPRCGLSTTIANARLSEPLIRMIFLIALIVANQKDKAILKINRTT